MTLLIITPASMMHLLKVGNDPIYDSGGFRLGGWKMPWWVLAILTIATIFNVIIATSIVLQYWRPDKSPISVSPEVALALHLQIFEAILAALAIGLAIFGLVGYAAIKQAAEAKADSTAREIMQQYANNSDRNSTPDGSNEPNLAGALSEPQNRERESEDL